MKFFCNISMMFHCSSELLDFKETISVDENCKVSFFSICSLMQFSCFCFVKICNIN